MRITYLDDDFLGVETGNNREVESALRDLSTSRWNAAEHRWEIHLSHLPDLIGLFRLPPDKIPQNLMKRFEESWLSCEVRVEVNHANCRILGSGVPVRDIEQLTSFELPDRVASPEFLEGEWDGRHHLFDRRAFTFPTGLLPPVVARLKELKKRFQIQDSRAPYEPGPAPPDELLAPLCAADRRLVEAARLAGRLTAVRQRFAGEGELIRALLATAGDSAVILAPTMLDAEELAALLEPHGVVLFRKAGDLGAKHLLLPIDEATALFAHMDREGAPRHFTAEEKRRALMIGLRMRRERALIVPRVSAIAADRIHTLAMHATEAAVRIAITRLPMREDGMERILAGAFGPWETFISAGDAVRDLGLPSVELKEVAAPFYYRVERDRPYSEILKNGIYENGPRTELIEQIAASEAEGGRTPVVLVEDAAFRDALAPRIAAHAVAYTYAEALEPLRILAAGQSDVVPTLLFAEPPANASGALRLLLQVCEAVGAPAAGKRSKAKRTLRLFDFRDPLPGLRRRNDQRFRAYQQFEGWIRLMAGSGGITGGGAAPITISNREPKGGRRRGFAKATPRNAERG
ncbi:MAG: hypothetical protein SF028_05075 [Candidatus Sumerlaeia bacterium]|nr:hypothetical protein [Candidatus Sumerlaeia bacterium]